jgi:hypothetical protein
MTNLIEIRGALEALQAQARSVCNEIDRRWCHVDDALTDADEALTDLGLELSEAADGLAEEEGGADIARQLRDVAELAGDLQAEIDHLRDRALQVLAEVGPIAEALEDIADPACDPDDPADDGDDAGE